MNSMEEFMMVKMILFDHYFIITYVPVGFIFMTFVSVSST
jgi:hypothetical protein